MTKIAVDGGFSSTYTAVEIIKSTYQSFLPDDSCESIYNNDVESREWSGYYWITKSDVSYTGSSCMNIYNKHPETRIKSGYYRISNNQWTFRNMTEIDYNITTYHSIPTCAGVGGGWRKIAKVDISAGDNCPSGWNKDTYSGYHFCQKSFDGVGCSSTIFTNNKITYLRVCGKARGYQKGHPNNEPTFSSLTIDDHYVNGLSITYGSSRQHIWTYANRDYDSISRGISCPCNGTVGTTPSFVDCNYHCESGRGSTDDHAAYCFDDPLWDGSGCMHSNCCSVPNQPWFHRHLNESTSANIEAKLCDKRYFISGFTMIDQLELYIQ